jgi:cysteine desulfuration protein SufE
MDNDNQEVPARLEEIIEDFQLSEGREKLELLLGYAEQMPPLPEYLAHNHSQMENVPECMTPVHLHAENTDGKLIFYFDVPEESPTVRGFASLMAAGLNGSSPEQVLRVPNDFFQQMGLDQVLTHQRLNGISAILAHMKRLALEAISN